MRFISFEVFHCWGGLLSHRVMDDMDTESSNSEIFISFIVLLVLQVIFDGEEAVDAGGVTKEFFLLLLKELMDPVYGMFTHYTDSNLLWFSDKVSLPLVPLSEEKVNVSPCSLWSAVEGVLTDADHRPAGSSFQCGETAGDRSLTSAAEGSRL